MQKNILLINGFWTPKITTFDLLQKGSQDSNMYLTFPLGIMNIAAWCREKLVDYNIEILDVMIELHKRKNKQLESISVENFIKLLLTTIKETPDYIGISFSSSNGHSTNILLANLLKEKWPNAQIIIGGVHATVFSHRLITEKSIDFIVKGVGDIIFPRLLQYLSENKDTSSIPGCISSIDELDSVSTHMEKLDFIPELPYDLIDMEYLVVNDEMASISEKDCRTGTIMMSRGCPFPCTYCAASQIHGKKVSFRPIDAILDEIELLIRRFNINQVCILDDLFGADKKIFYQFFEEIEKRNIDIKVLIPGGLSLNVFDTDMIDVLITKGMTSIAFPLESGSEHVQKKVIKKRVNLKKAKYLIEYTKNKNIFTSVNIVIGSPGETVEMMMETYKYIKELAIDWVNFFMAYPYPGTEMTNTLLQRGDLIEEDLLSIWDNSTQGFKGRPFDTQEIKGDALTDLVYDFNIKLNFFENYNIKHRRWNIILPKLDKIIQRYPFHIVAQCCRAKSYYEMNNIEKSEEDLSEVLLKIKKYKNSKEMYIKYKSEIKNMIYFNDLLDEIA